ncbi:type IV pilus modification protein PilV [Marinobacter sp. OP 3.4]|uniref:type IV pilus modification protein PilV n=1 Tax=Marinobacter sp. OP 3.4 TaxID=3076501 RepID=UPI002E22546B
MNTMKRSLRKQGGVSLIEVLVAVLVLAVGLLGVAGLQSASLKKSTDVYFSQQAMTYSQDLINRIMANRDAASTGDYADDPPTSEPGKNCSSSTCTSAEMADWDLWQWNQDLTTGFGAPPSASATVNWANATGEYTIAITWDAEGLGADYEAPTCTADDNNSRGCFFAAYRVM